MPVGVRATPTRFLFKTKLDTKGEVERYRARLLYQNNPWSGNYSPWEDTFAPVVDKNSLRMFLHMAAQEHMYLRHTDVVSAFIQAKMEGEVYVKLPEFCGDPSGFVRRLLRALNGVTKASQLWHKTFHEFMVKEGFTPNPRDPCLYVHNKLKLFCALYVDDILSAAKNEKQLLSFLKRMEKMFKVRQLGPPTVFLGMELNFFREVGICTLSQKHYINKLGAKFLRPNQLGFPPTTPIETNIQEKLLRADTEPNFSGTYRELVGGLLYATVCTRPDMAFATCILTQQFANPKPTHWKMALRALQYLLGTNNFGITLGGPNIPQITAFTDSDFAACLKTRKSLGGFIIYFGNSPIIWSAKKHSGVQALSSTESELVQSTVVLREILWFQPLAVHLGYSEIIESTYLKGDNQSTISNIKTDTTHGRTKHMDLRYKFCGEVYKLGKVKICYVPTEHNIADIFTKALATVRFRALRSALVSDLTAIISNPSSAQIVGNHITSFIQPS